MLYPVIFKRTSTGATQMWQQEIDDANPGQFRSISGQVDGKKTTSSWTLCEGTNVGRSNERTPEQQAIFEVEANYKKKLEKDYHTSVDQIDVDIIFKPMLANEYKKHADGFVFNIKSTFAQPKLDGMRCITNSEGQFSRNGKPVIGCPHITEELQNLFDANPDLVLDGELYNHEYKADFNSIMSSVKKKKPTAEHLKISKEVVQYHVYDMPSVKGKFSERSEAIKKLLSGLKYVVVVETIALNSKSDFDTYYEKCLEEGYEGAMLRKNTLYSNKRTSDLLKRKETIDQEFILVDLEEGKGNWSGKAKRATLKLIDSDITFGAGVTGTREYCADILINKEKYIGKKATVVYQMLTPDKIPRFGRVKELDRQDV